MMKNPAIRSRTTCWPPKPRAAPSTAAGATKLATGTPSRSRTSTTVIDQMSATATQVRAWATAWRCLDASERTRASWSVAAASIRSVTRRPTQPAKRASSTAPRTSSTISRPLLRSQTLMSVSGAIVGPPFTTSRRARWGGEPLQELPQPGWALHHQVGVGQQRLGCLGRADRDPQGVAELGGGGEGAQVAKVVAGHHHRAGAGLGHQLADGVALVAGHGRAQLPDQLAGDDLQAVPGGDLPGGLVDRPGPAAG